MTDIPWSVVKIAFDAIPWCEDENFFDVMWERYGCTGTHNHLLPTGWGVTETYFTPINAVVICEVDVIPTVEDGLVIKRLLEDCSSYSLKGIQRYE